MTKTLLKQLDRLDYNGLIALNRNVIDRMRDIAASDRLRFAVGDKVTIKHNGTLEGKVIKIMRKNVKVQVGSRIYRVTPLLLSKGWNI